MTIIHEICQLVKSLRQTECVKASWLKGRAGSEPRTLNFVIQSLITSPSVTLTQAPPKPIWKYQKGLLAIIMENTVGQNVSASHLLHIGKFLQYPLEKYSLIHLHRTHMELSHNMSTPSTSGFFVPTLQYCRGLVHIFLSQITLCS